jgi:hypothetical protein
MPMMEPPPSTAGLAVVVVHAQPGERAELEEVAAAVDQARHALARQQLAALLELVAFGGRPSRTLASSARTSASRSAMRAALAAKAGDGSVDQGRDDRHQSSFSTSGVTPRWKPSKGAERLWSAIGNSGVSSGAPPSMASVTPVMKAAPGESRKQIAR